MRVGIDIVEVERIHLTDNFLEKIASTDEIAYIRTYKTEHSQKESCAGLWAVKEAVFKLLGLGRNSGVSFKNVELCHEENSRPYVKLNGVALEAFKTLGLYKIDVSITHTENYASAVAIANG